VNRKVLLIGATGVFGSRLAAMLAAMPGLSLVLAARSRESLDQLRATLAAQAPAAAISVQVFDRSHVEALAQIRPWLVIDAAGPFQESSYDLALAAVRQGAHYLDLADARGFVAGFPNALEAAASASGVLAVTGASSTPALSHAVLRMVTKGWRRLDAVTAAISPGARAPRGLAVVRAILSYAGRPVRVFRNGGWETAPGWSDLHRLDMPGLGYRWGSLCETPDLDLLPASFSVRHQALFLAGLELATLHFGLVALSLPVRWGLARSLRPLARPLRALAGWLAPLGSDRGGMIVAAVGMDERGTPIRARWALWADANAGPSIPAAPAAALVRILLAGRDLPSGAMACTALLEIDDIMHELDGLPIRTRVDDSHVESPVLYCRLLGRRFERLPAAVKQVHGAESQTIFVGRALARSGRSIPARFLRLVLGLPRTGRSDVEVRLEPDLHGETWTRRFGSARFSSRLTDTRRLGVFQEQFGPIRFVFRLEPTARGVVWRMIGWNLAGLPLPLRLAPQTKAHAEAVDGRYRFRVVVSHSWLGLLFAYRGDLA